MEIKLFWDECVCQALYNLFWAFFTYKGCYNQKMAKLQLDVIFVIVHYKKLRIPHLRDVWLCSIMAAV